MLSNGDLILFKSQSYKRNLVFKKLFSLKKQISIKFHRHHQRRDRRGVRGGLGRRCRVLLLCLKLDLLSIQKRNSDTYDHKSNF